MALLIPTCLFRRQGLELENARRTRVSIRCANESQIGVFINDSLVDSEVVCVLGEIDVSNVQFFAEAVDRASLGACARIDLRHCTYLDSAALDVLVKCRRRIGTKLHVQAGGHGVVRRAFDSTELSKVLQVDYDE
ncbi:MAG: STAS domain-containing protein [Vulcanimicrobiaceae bacterium]